MMWRTAARLLVLGVLCLVFSAGCTIAPSSPRLATDRSARNERAQLTPNAVEAGQAIHGLQLVGHLGSGQATALAVWDGVAYAGFDIQFGIVDLRGAVPRRLGTLVLPARVVDIGLIASAAPGSGPSYAYVVVAGDTGLYVVDVSDPTAPTLIDHLYPQWGVTGLEIDSGYAYVSGSGLHVLDLSDPVAPTEVSSLRLPGGPTTTSGDVVAVKAGRAYLRYYDHYQQRGGFWIVDVSNPQAPLALGAARFDERVGALVPGDEYAYLLVGQEAGRLVVVNVSDPEIPVEVPLATGDLWMAHSLALSGHILSLAGSEGDRASGYVHVLDVRDPAHPATRGRLTGFAPHLAALTLEGPVATLGVGDGLARVDLSDPEQPAITARYAHDSLPGLARAVAVEGRYAYVAAGPAGLQVVDVSDAASPRVAAGHDTPGHAWDLALAGDYVLLADEYTGLRIVEVADPLHPVEVGAYDVPGPYEFFHGVATEGAYAYVADGSLTETGLWVIDLSDPARPAAAGFLPLAEGAGEPLPPRVEDVVVDGSLVYLAAGTTGLQVVDVSDPVAPVYIGAYDTPGRADNLAIAGQRLYFSDGDLRIVDISVPSAPALVGFYDVPTMADTPYVAVRGAYAYLTGEGLRVLDASDPGALVLVASHPFATGRVAVAGDDVYVVGNGLFLLRTSPRATTSITRLGDVPDYCAPRVAAP